MLFYSLSVVDLLRLKARVAIEPACTIVMPFAGDFDMVATALAGQLFHPFDDFRAVASIPVVFVDSEVHNAKVLRILPGWVVTHLKSEKADGFVGIDEEIVGNGLIVEMRAETVVGNLFESIVDEFIQVGVLLHRSCEAIPTLNEGIELIYGDFNEFHTVTHCHLFFSFRTGC